MIKQIIINFLGIFNSRVLGFIRDLLSASILGANIYSDIFFVAFKFPNLFRRIFAEGAFTQSFLPSFEKSRFKPKFAFEVFKYTFLIIFTLSVIVNLFSYPITSILAYGFSEEAKRIAAPLVAINFWYLDLIFIVTFFAALLQRRDHFFTTAFSTAFLNISFIVALLLSRDLSKLEIIYYMSYGVVIGGILQVFAHLLAAKYKGILKLLIIGAKSKKRVSLNEFKKSFIPSIFGNSTAHISAFLDTWLATFLVAGSISYLYYANRLFQLPFALFAIAISTVIFPKLNKSIKKSEFKKANELMKKSFWILLYLLTLATIVTFVADNEIVKVLFQRGEFTQKDSEITAKVLVMYIIGLIPFGLNKLFLNYLYATHKHLKAAKFSAISLFANIVFSIVLIFPLKVYGLALASSIGGWVQFYLVIKEYGIEEFKKFFTKREVFIFVLVIFGSIILGFGFEWVLNLIYNYLKG